MRNATAATACGLAFLAVAFGAFGAHALRDHFLAMPEARGWYETAAHYHLIHAIAMLLAAVIESTGRPLARCAAWLFGAGIILFSGSLYALALTGIRGFGVVTPAGGVCFLAGWLLLLIACARGTK